MEQVRTEQPIAAKRRRGPSRPFKQSDPRINRGGLPSEVRAFHNWMRQSFARFLQEGTKDGLTNGEQIISAAIKLMQGMIAATTLFSCITTMQNPTMPPGDSVAR